MLEVEWCSYRQALPFRAAQDNQGYNGPPGWEHEAVRRAAACHVKTYSSSDSKRNAKVRFTELDGNMKQGQTAWNVNKQRTAKRIVRGIRLTES
jgi:hypothetical protein